MPSPSITGPIGAVGAGGGAGGGAGAGPGGPADGRPAGGAGGAPPCGSPPVGAGAAPPPSRAGADAEGEVFAAAPSPPDRPVSSRIATPAAARSTPVPAACATSSTGRQARDVPDCGAPPDGVDAGGIVSREGDACSGATGIAEAHVGT